MVDEGSKDSDCLAHSPRTPIRKAIKDTILFLFSKRAKKMKIYVERERASWNEKKKKRKKKATLKGTVAAVGKLLKSKRGKNKSTKKEEKAKKIFKVTKRRGGRQCQGRGLEKSKEKVKNAIKSGQKTSRNIENSKTPKSDARRNSNAKEKDQQDKSYTTKKDTKKKRRRKNEKTKTKYFVGHIVR